MSDQMKNDAKRWRTRGRELEEVNAGLAQRAIEDIDTIASLLAEVKELRAHPIWKTKGMYCEHCAQTDASLAAALKERDEAKRLLALQLESTNRAANSSANRASDLAATEIERDEALAALSAERERGRVMRGALEKIRKGAMDGSLSVANIKTVANRILCDLSPAFSPQDDKPKEECGKCDEPDCRGLGLIGNENIVNGKKICDYCHARIGPTPSAEAAVNREVEQDMAGIGLVPDTAEAVKPCATCGGINGKDYEPRCPDCAKAEHGNDHGIPSVSPCAKAEPPKESWVDNRGARRMTPAPHSGGGEEEK